MLTSFEIIPNEGLGEIKFGMLMKDFISKFGRPDDIDEIDDDEDEELKTTLLHYWNKGISVFFVGMTTQLLAGIETDHPDTTLFGKKIMGMTRQEIEDLMSSKGHSYYETEREHSVVRLSYDIGMMDFFFQDNKLIYMNLGVLVNENGEIETVEN